MCERYYSFARQIFIIILSILIGSPIFAQTQETKKALDLDRFEDSVHHWYQYFTDYVVKPLPGKPQYDPTEIEAIADNMLLFQRDNGGWPKNYDMQAILTDEQKEKLLAVKPLLHTTFDNSTTHTQVCYLAEAYTITNIERFKEGCLKGIDFILSAQYENGGWPQYYPPLPENNKYSTQITFNDGGYVGIMNTLKKIIDKDPNFLFVDNTRQKKAKIAFDKGLECILKMQIVEDGVPKVWCQQHDENSLEPVWARTFEPPCFCNGESSGVVLLLMSIENPSKEVIASVQGAVNWFEKVKILNTLCIDDPTAPQYVSVHRVHNVDRRIVHDLNAPPIWTRYSELKTGRDMFCDRSSEIVYNMSDLGRERRSGYGWYTYAPQAVLDKYPDWKKKWVSQN